MLSREDTMLSRRSLIALAAGAAALPGKAMAQASGPRSSKAMDEAKRTFLDFPLGQRLATLDLQLDSGRTLQLKVQEGAMTMVAIGEAEPLRFVADADRGGAWRFRTISQSMRRMDGRTVPFLRVSPPVPWGAYPDDALRRFGATSINLATVSELPGGGASTSSFCWQPPCDEIGWVCCVFMGCDQRLVMVCTRGRCVGGGDGCGECFVCS
jgi:hypothetical protein